MKSYAPVVNVCMSMRRPSQPAPLYMQVAYLLSHLGYFSLEPVFPHLMVGTVGTLLTLRGTGCIPRKLLVRLFRHSPHPYESLSLFRGHGQAVPKSIIPVHPCTLLRYTWGSIWHQRCQGTWRLVKSGSCPLWPHHKSTQKYYSAVCAKWGVQSHCCAVCPSDSCSP